MGDDASAHFDEAVAYVRSLPEKPSAGAAAPPTTEQRLAFYALYKQATLGPQPASARRPYAYDPAGQFKHDAWATLGDLAAEEARARYVHVMALVVLVGAVREARSGGGGWYAAALASDAPPAFVRRVLAPAPGEVQPALWALGGDFAAAVAAADELPLPADVTLELAALRDQALYGDVNIAKPGLMASFATSVSGSEW
jgi:acyl-CoA-binding protein